MTSTGNGDNHENFGLFGFCIIPRFATMVITNAVVILAKTMERHDFRCFHFNPLGKNDQFAWMGHIKENENKSQSKRLTAKEANSCEITRDKSNSLYIS